MMARMEKWLIRLCRAAMMGIGWGAAWVPVSLSVGPVIERFTGLVDEPWFIAGVITGFPCGAVFSVIAGIATERRALDELPVGRAAALGAASGLLVGVAWLVLALLSDPPKWLFEGMVVASLTLLSAVSGAGAALMARIGNNRKAHAI